MKLKDNGADAPVKLVIIFIMILTKYFFLILHNCLLFYLKETNLLKNCFVNK